MLILISNPSKQYTHHAVKALSQHYDVLFATAFWHQPNKGVGKWLQKISWLKIHLAKKADDTINANIIITHWTGIVYKFLGRFFIKDVERWSYIEDRIHDRWVSKKIASIKPAVVIGYEKSCYKTFTVAKQLGIKTILDVSQVHALFIEQLRQQFSFFATISGSQKLFKTITKLKQQEYLLANHITTLSAFAKNTFIQFGEESNKVSVASLGFNPHQFSIPSINTSSNTLQLIFVGIVTYRKGIHLLIELMNQWQHLPIHLTVIGPRGDASKLLNTQSTYPNITYIPFLTHTELVVYLQKSHVFVLPSFLDSWAAVVIEAMACGLPAIVTENTGAKDVINGTNGCIIETGNKEQLAEAILQYANSIQQIEAKKNLIAASVQAYTWQPYYNQIQAMVNNLVAL